MQTLNISKNPIQLESGLQEMVALLSGKHFFSKIIKIASIISLRLSVWLQCFLIKRTLIKLQLKANLTLAQLKEDPSIITSAFFLLVIENIERIEKLQQTTLASIMQMRNIGNIPVLLQNVIVTFKEIESFIIEDSFKDNTAFGGFSSAFNGWNDKEDDVWDTYL